MTAGATSELSDRERSSLHQIFDRTYADADHGHLDRSLGHLGRVALAHRGDAVVGFAIGDQRRLDLPQVGACRVLLIGLCCVEPSHRRQGIATRLEEEAVQAPVSADRELPVMTASRVAHPASYRVMAKHPGVVPRTGWRPGDLHRLAGAAVAQAFGSSAFDGDRFICIGSGHSIGRPIMEVEASTDELQLFDQVDRHRGDSLLTMAWITGQPPWW